MPLLECANIHRDFQGTTVLDSVSLQVDPGEKIGLVGPNGAGKTTLLRILAGFDDDFRGTLSRKAGLRIGFLSQHIEPAGEGTALDFLLDGAREAEKALRIAEEALSEATGKELGAAMTRYQAALDRWETLGGDEAENRARRSLALLGLPGRENTRAASLSGGERGTLALARALQNRPELLILDEPGNHLDFWGMAWLEDFIASSKEAVLLVSHSRALLDRCAGRILELEGGKIAEYSGGYSDYRLKKLRDAASQGEDWQASRKKIARLELMVQRAAVLASAHADKAYGQRLRARRHQLEREKESATDRPTIGSSSITASFSGRGAADAKSDYALIVKGYSRAFGDRALFDGAGFDVLVGERVAIVGPNGCGKTTFLRELVDSGAWDHQSLRVGPSMRVGYVAQDRDGFARGRTVRQEFESLGARESELRGLLKDFGFGRGDPDRNIDSLSGGELNRLQLARAIYTRANFLVLDEPTNHLDLDAREAVEDKLAEWDGTILVVSHDRYFLEKVASRIVYVEGGRFEAFDGGFGEFWAETGASLRPDAFAKSSKAPEARAKSVERAHKRRDSDVESKTMEARIIELENSKESLERKIRERFSKRDFAEAKRLARDLEALQAEIDRCYAKWS
jgi:ATP-binding cassette subfamily F protein 3